MDETPTNYTREDIEKRAAEMLRDGFKKLHDYRATLLDEDKLKLADYAAKLLLELGDTFEQLQTYGCCSTLTVHGEDSTVSIPNVTGEFVLRVDANIGTFRAPDNF